MSKADDEFQALRQLAEDYRPVVEELKARGWIEEHQPPEMGLITSTELAPPQSDRGYIAIDFAMHPATVDAGDNTVIVRLAMKRPDDNRIRIFTAADVAQIGRASALESFRGTVMDYASELEK